MSLFSENNPVESHCWVLKDVFSMLSHEGYAVYFYVAVECVDKGVRFLEH